MYFAEWKRAVDAGLLGVAACYRITAGGVNGATCTLVAESGQVDAGFGLAANRVTVPSLGRYELALFANLSSGSATDNIRFGLGIYNDGTLIAQAGGRRFSTSSSHTIDVATSRTFRVTDLADLLDVRVFETAGGTIGVSNTGTEFALFSITRIGD